MSRVSARLVEDDSPYLNRSDLDSRLAGGPHPPSYSPAMSIEFGWWNKDEDGKKFQVSAVVHGGNIEWTKHQGHHSSWVPYTPDDDDRERLVYEA